MQMHHMFGGSLAFAAIIGLVVFNLFIVPRTNLPEKNVKFMKIVVMAGSVFMLALGAVISLLGRGWFE